MAPPTTPVPAAAARATGGAGLISRRRTLSVVAGAAAAALLGLSACSPGRQETLQCRHQRNGEVYAEIPIGLGARITHSWIHSIELSRWTDTFEVTEDALMLVRAEFSAYGAGMPLDEGEVTVTEDGIVVDRIDREFEAIRWVHSHRAAYRIGVDGDESLIDPGELPDNEPLELRRQ